jgi:putative ABC transport system permease protein
MSLWRHVTRGLRVLSNRTAAHQDAADELQDYLEHATAAFAARGLAPAEARRAAQLELGNLTVAREQVRAYGWENLVENFFDDLRYAVRRLLHRPGFTAVSVMTLALGIGSTTAIFSVINGILLKPLPYPHSDRLVSLMHTAPGINLKDLNMAPSLYFLYSDESRVFEDVSLWNEDTSTVTGLAEPEEVPALLVTHRFLPALGVQPALGRPFTAADEHPKSARTVMLSDGYWRSRFGGDPSVVGRSITVDGSLHEVIGVLPPSFRFMDFKTSLLVPLRFDRAEVRLLNFSYQGIARLKPGVTLEQANADTVRMLPMAPERFIINPGFTVKMFTDAHIAGNLRLLKDDLVGDIGKTLWVLMGTVGIVLLIACANVANLLLVRAAGRRQELAVRSALGAGWGRIGRELLIESLLLSAIGGALGLALAGAALEALAASNIAHLPRMESIGIDLSVLAFTLGISLASGLLFGLIPVFKYARPQLGNVLRSAGRSLSESKERHRARSILVVAQVALALVLLVGSGLMIRTFQALRHVDPGFSGAEHVQTFRISIPEAQVKEPAAVIRMQEQITRKIGAIAGVSSVAMATSLPQDNAGNDPVYAEDHVYVNGSLPPIRRYKFISPGYVSAMGTRLIAGRDLTWGETYQRTPVALISENLARDLWRDPRAAIGKRIRPTPKDDWREVIGVIADIRDDGVDQKAPAVAYWPLLQKNFETSETYIRRSVAVVVRTPRAGTTSLLREIGQAVASVNPNLPVASVRTLQSIYDRGLARTSFTLILLAISGGMAMILGVIGIYGVISYSVSQRTREIGIRLALGSPLQEVTGMFVRHGLVLSAIGAACGLTAAFALTRLMKSILFDVSPADPLTYVAASIALILAAMLASYFPARRATTVNPIEALRAE